ncbi:MAG: AAA family ATPase, partial [Longimicrobiales bacterium]
MSPPSAHHSLTTEICPWLLEPLQQLERAHREGRFAHGWLLAGPEGIGKINLALVAAQRLLAPRTDPPRTLGPEEGARAMAARHERTDHHPDLHWVFPEPNRRSLSVDQIRDTTDALTLTSLEGPAKVVVLEPADAMTTSAANALLKTLEEPTARTYLLLIAHQPGRLPATIRSRCQHLSIPRPAPTETLDWLSRGDTEVSEADWRQLLALADGAPFRAVAFHSSDYIRKNKELEDSFDLISQNKLDPQTVADQWLKDDLE